MYLKRIFIIHQIKLSSKIIVKFKFEKQNMKHVSGFPGFKRHI